MLNEKSIAYLELSESQLEKFRELAHKEEVLRSVLEDCNLAKGVYKHIMRTSDLTKVDDSNLEALKEAIRTEYKDYIFDRKQEYKNVRWNPDKHSFEALF